MKGRRKSDKAGTTATQFIEGTPPDWLSEYAKETWIQTLADIDRAGRKLDMLDTEAFLGFCQAAGLARQCTEIISREGVCVDGGREGTKRHPACSTQNAALSQVRQFAAELGLTVASRGRLPSPPQRPNTQESWYRDLAENRPEELAEFIAEHGHEPTNEFDII